MVGLGAPIINDGMVENTGVEFGLTYNNTIRGLFTGNYKAQGLILTTITSCCKFGQREIGDSSINQNGQPWNSLSFAGRRIFNLLPKFKIHQNSIMIILWQVI
ncbi:hypothetical protein CS542_02085 [Pedobacter sp. IW39]|nr:hypothetical protein CS542_02085 [Pedobacter sp. IW39]